MAVSDVLGLGGQSEFLTDWKTARDFVQNTVINKNPRITTDTKNKLLLLEEEKFELYHGQWLASEREEIAQYWNGLKNDVPSITQDEGILAIFDSGAEAARAAADPDKEAGINIDDTTTAAAKTLSKTALVGLGLLAFFMLKKK